MTVYDQRVAAIELAVETALLRVGLETLRSGEFFGTGQKVMDVAQAA